MTFRTGSVNHARFAPDGQTIVYSAAWGTDPIAIFSTRLGSEEFRELGAPGADLLSISSSGEMLVLRQRIGVRGGTLARVALAGGAEREILESVMDAAWAPNGKDIAVVRLGEKMRLEFPIGRVLSETTGQISAPLVSPRGDLVAFVDHPQRFDSIGSLAVADLQGRKRRLTENFNEIAAVAWSPEGDEIWFSAWPPNASEAIYAVTLSGRQRVVVRGPGAQVLQTSPGSTHLGPWTCRMTGKRFSSISGEKQEARHSTRHTFVLRMVLRPSASAMGRHACFRRTGNGR